jgi:hypothetical protein
MDLVAELLAYRFPALEKKLLAEKMVDGPDEARALLDEVKKYLFLARADPGRQWPMFSRRIDEVWHQFVLFTVEYRAFSTRFFGEFVHHTAFTAPGEDERPTLTFPQFQARYQEQFGPLSGAWWDERAVTADTRLIRVTFGKPLLVQVDPATDKAALLWCRTPPQVLIRLDARGADALRFIMDNDHFYVRELPGLSAPDRLAVCRALVASRVLRVAP